MMNDNDPQASIYGEENLARISEAERLKPTNRGQVC